MGEHLPCKQGVKSSSLSISIGVAIRPGDTPVPIPNTTVKPGTAASTAPGTVWEGRWLRH